MVNFEEVRNLIVFKISVKNEMCLKLLCGYFLGEGFKSELSKKTFQKKFFSFYFFDLWKPIIPSM